MEMQAIRATLSNVVSVFFFFCGSWKREGALSLNPILFKLGEGLWIIDDLLPRHTATTWCRLEREKKGKPTNSIRNCATVGLSTASTQRPSQSTNCHWWGFFILLVPYRFKGQSYLQNSSILAERHNPLQVFFSSTENFAVFRSNVSCSGSMATCEGFLRST